MRKRKSSLSITLVLIGAAGLGACGRSDEPQMRRDVYASLEDCRADWGRVENCEAFQSQGSGTTGSTTRYYGPSYHSSSTSSSTSGFSASSRSTRAIGSQSVSRGGFGASSSFHSSGG